MEAIDVLGEEEEVAVGFGEIIFELGEGVVARVGGAFGAVNAALVVPAGD